MTAKSITRQQRIITRHRDSALAAGDTEFGRQQTALADAAEVNLRMTTDKAYAASRGYRMAYAT